MRTQTRLLALAALLAASSHAADLYRVSGVIVNSQTGAPLARARLAVTAQGATRVLESATAGEDGRFAFDLPAGKYRLWGGTRDVFLYYGMPTPDAMVGSSIITGPGQKTDNLTFRWYATSAIEGTIVDENGDPVENAIIQLVRSTVQGGRRIMATAGWGRTDDRGYYRFGRLPGSTYYLAVTGTPWYTNNSGVFRAEAGETKAYLPVYYPAGNDPARAVPIALRPGEDFRADFILRTVPGVTVTVQIPTGLSLTGNLGLVREGLAASDEFQVQASAIPGRNLLRGVPPGRYSVYLNATADRAPVTARQTIDVGASDLEVKISPKPRPVIAGTVQFESSSMKPKATLLVSVLREINRSSVSATVRPDGTFSLPGVAASPFRPILRGTDGFFASHIEVEGADFRDGLVTPAEGATVNIRIVASDRTGRIDGLVMDGDTPVEGVWVVLAPVSLPTNWSLYHGFQTDSDGSFDWPNIPAGDYFLFAAKAPYLEYTNPSALGPYLTGAERVTVAPHGRLTKRLPVTVLPKQ